MNGEKGFTYFAALLMIIVVSASLMVAQKQWSTIMKREREKELFFRAEQIIAAIQSYYESSPDDSKQYPDSFKVLIKDDRFPATKRHLRKWYKDPITKEDSWGIVYDGKGKMKGVFSMSSDEPMKKDGFAEKYKDFKNKKSYSDWKFVYEEKKETAS